MIAHAANATTLSAFQQMSDAEFLSATGSTKELDSLSLDVLSYIANRYAGFVGNGSKHRSRKPPVNESVFVVYWITDKLNADFPLYVGVTKNIAERWKDHRNGSLELSGIGDRTRITIKAVETIVGTSADALRAESLAIKSALAINPNLLNRTNPLGLSGGAN